MKYVVLLIIVAVAFFFMRNANNSKVAIKNNDQDNAEEELGDLLFTIINVSRHLNIDANEALARANNKFVSRFHSMEKEVATSQKGLENTSLEELEKIWSKIKNNE